MNRDFSDAPPSASLLSKPHLVGRLRAGLENAIMTALAPLDGPGTVFRWVFKVPLLFDRLGLHRLLPPHVLILTTIGRKSGQPRKTPLEYMYDPATDTYQVMAGWAGKTDWYRNARANPNVVVQVGSRSFPATAVPLPDDRVAQALIDITRMNPGSLKIWSRWAGRPLDGSEASLRQATPYFPMLCLVPSMKK
ncbi:MAG: nitroreductase family deazaflavin-dependent oxidoreductase [Anaerolineae bacterium]